MSTTATIEPCVNELIEYITARSSKQWTSSTPTTS